MDVCTYIFSDFDKEIQTNKAYVPPTLTKNVNKLTKLTKLTNN